jgi:hypothetical protein
MRPHAEILILEYIFNEDVKELPELGGILSSHQKKPAIDAHLLGCFTNITKQTS